MADPTVTNTATNVGSAATTTCTFGFTATSGRLLVLAVAADDYKTGDPSGWTLSTGCSQQHNAGHYLWWKVSAGNETSVQYTIGSATHSVWVVKEFDNIDGTPYDTSNGQNAGSSASYTTPAVTPSTGRRFAIASICGAYSISDFSGVDTWTNSYTEIADNATTGAGTRDLVSLATLALDGNGSSTTSTGATFGGAISAQTVSGIIAVFKVASGTTSITKKAAAHYRMMRNR